MNKGERTINPNSFAYMALFSWPIVTFLLYQRKSVVKATLWSILGAYLILPAKVSVDLPMIPPLDKMSISSLSAFIICRAIYGKQVKLLPNIGVGKLLLLIYVISPFFTTAFNPDPIIAGPLFINGMKYYDALSAIIRQLIFILPLVLGYSLLRDNKLPR